MLRSILVIIICMNHNKVQGNNENHRLAQKIDENNDEVNFQNLIMNFNFTDNKTETELAIEECMIEYTTCTRTDRKKPLCAENELGNKLLFQSLCDMEYENCRNTQSQWHYIKDEKC